MNIKKALSVLQIQKENGGTSTGSKWLKGGGELLVSHSPVDGKRIASVEETSPRVFEKVIDKAHAAFEG